MPSLENVYDVIMFLGMVNQLGKFTDHLADKTKPIKKLLQSDREWTLQQAQQRAFQQAKKNNSCASVSLLRHKQRNKNLN